VILLLALESIFSGSEMAIIGCDKLKIRAEAARGGRGAALLEHMLKKPEWLLGTCLVGTNLAVVTNTIFVTFLLAGLFPEKGEFYTVLVMSPLVLFWGEILPKTYFQQKADLLAPKVIYFLWIASRVFSPLLWFITVFPGLLSRLVRKDLQDKQGVLLQRVDLKLLLRMPQIGSDMLAEEIRMVDRLIELSNKTVEEVMIPLVDVSAVPETTTWEQAVRVIVEKGYSRIPVFRERIVHIVGILHHFDLLLAEEQAPGTLPPVRPAFYVPETKQVYELLLQMKRSGSNMAIAVDEYGGAVGIITVEDILEEIVGEIEDEYDPARSLYKKIGPSSYLFNARAEMEFLNEKFLFGLPEGDYETLGGFLTSRVGRILEEKETFRFGNLLFTIEKATPRAIRQVRIDVQ
jgi:CBS domain containing-hemolysin-like protein